MTPAELVKSVGRPCLPPMALPDRVLPRSRRAADPQLQARRRAGIGAAPAPRRVAVPRGQGLERDVQAMVMVTGMLRRGAGRWLRAIAGTP
jgi:hypothetical protein